jgi:O-antigen/teichoic acid export membrane protein
MDGSFLKHASVYGLAKVLLRAAGFLLLPIYLRCLTPADYGILEVVERMAETVGICLMFGGFRQTLLTFYSQADDEGERRQVVCTALALVLVAAVVGGALALSVSQTVIGLLGVESVGPGLVRLAILGIILEPFSLVPLSLVQARMQSVTYVGVALAQTLLRLVLCIVLVKFLNWGVTGALAATVAQGILFGALLCLRELVRGASWPSWEQARGMLSFALPIMPGGLCLLLLNHGDRFFLLHHCTTDEIGTYSLGYKLAMAVTLVSLDPLHMVWSARLYAEARRPDAADVFGRVFTRFLGAYLVVGLGLCLFAAEVVRILGGPVYADAAQFIAPVVLACFFKEAAGLMDAGFYVRRRTGVKLGITLAATAVTLALYMAWIPRWGGQGAALATLGGFGFLAVATWWATQRIFPVHYEWGRLSAGLGLATGAWLVGVSLPSDTWAILARGGLFVLTLLLAWFTGLIRPEEKQWVKESTTRALESSRGWFLPRLADTQCQSGRLMLGSLWKKSDRSAEAGSGAFAATDSAAAESPSTTM